MAKKSLFKKQEPQKKFDPTEVSMFRVKTRGKLKVAPGSAPGTFKILPGGEMPLVRVIAYNPDEILEKEVEDLDEIPGILEKFQVVWLDVTGLTHEKTLRRVAKMFKIHELALEDVVNAHQRAKIETFDENLYCVMRMPCPSADLLTEQLSLFLGDNYVVTFQEYRATCFNLVRQRLRSDISQLRRECKADFLAYQLIDAAVDHYFPLLESQGARLDQLDSRTAQGDGKAAFAELHKVKRELLMLKRSIWPLRDMITELRADITPRISDNTRIYLRDCYDHTAQLIDIVESYRDICSDLRDFYLSSVSHRLNEVMQMLTIIATIFIPLSFIAGVYGMNFDPEISPWNMPELSWTMGYPFALGLMTAVAGGMLLFFYRRGWIGSSDLPDDD